MPVLEISGHPEVRITSLVHDSRRAMPGSLFFALPGSKTDGSLFIREALQKGAAGIVSEKPRPQDITKAWARVSSVPEAMGKIANLFFGDPSSSMCILGATGTNGKTTITYFLESILNSCGARPAVIGTISYRGPGIPPVKSANTTPLSLEILEILARLRDSGATHVAMEVSSHALALKRVEEINFDAAIFANLKRDHLDFHKTLEEYFKAKAHLFELLERSPKKDRIAVINADDERAEVLASQVKKPRKIFYGLSASMEEQESHGLAIKNLHCDINGSKFTLRYKGKEIPASIRLLGRHNVSNALAAAAVALEMGLPQKEILLGLQYLALVPGRLEAVKSNQPFKLFIDYAHTDSAIEAVLAGLREITQGRVITVFGCGGERDQTKRGPMGEAASRLSDMVLITSDNPRGEDPSVIIKDIEGGIERAGGKNYKIIPDRSQAIVEAVRLARAGDVVLIAGKGHEDYQIMKDKTIAFNDRDVAKAALNQ